MFWLLHFQSGCLLMHLEKQGEISNAWAPGFSLMKPWLLQSFQKWTSRSLSPCLPVSLSLISPFKSTNLLRGQRLKTTFQEIKTFFAKRHPKCKKTCRTLRKAIFHICFTKHKSLKYKTTPPNQQLQVCLILNYLLLYSTKSWLLPLTEDKFQA